MNRQGLYWRLLVLVLVLTIIVISVVRRFNGQNQLSQSNDFLENQTVLIGSNSYAPDLMGQFLLFYDISGKQIVKFDLELHRQEYFDAGFEVGDQILWSPSATQVLFHQLGKAWQHLDFTINKTTILHHRIFTPAWNRDGTKIAYFFIPEDLARNTLTIANPDGSNWQSIFDLEEKNKIYQNLWWGPSELYLLAIDDHSDNPNYEKILLSSKKVESIGVGSGKLRLSPDGSLVLISSLSEQPKIWRLENNNIETLTLVISVDKIIWQDQDHLIWIDANNHIYRYTIAKQSNQKIGEIAGEIVDRLIGVYQDQLIFTQGLKLSTLKLKALNS